MVIRKEFNISADSDMLLWRYMSFDKLKDLILNSNLFFSRADTFSDDFEGSMSKPHSGEIFMTLSDGSVSKDIKLGKNFFLAERQSKFISCWHVNDNESSLMWNSYSGKGVAVQTTYSRLKQLLDKSDERIDVGLVEYSDYQEGITINSPRYFNKHISYAGEREFRAMITDMQGSFMYSLQKSPLLKKGILVNVDIVDLIEKIYVSPACDVAVKEQVELLCKSNNLNIDVFHSCIPQQPIF